MKRKKKYVRGLINHCLEMYKVPRIPVYIHWEYPVVAGETGAGFGVFVVNKDGSNACIHLGGAMGAGIVMESFAHEFVHYMQFLHKRELEDVNIEEDAEYWANAVKLQYIINKKSKTKRIDGVGNCWENKPNGGEGE